MNDREQIFEILRMLASLLGGVAFLGWCVVSVIQSIRERPFGPAGEIGSETGSETDSETKSDTEQTLAESGMDGQESSSARTDSGASLEP